MEDIDDATGLITSNFTFSDEVVDHQVGVIYLSWSPADWEPWDESPGI